eukprot:m51a1_g13678 hypothetical protein (428) ;mRNA; f:181-1605
MATATREMQHVCIGPHPEDTVHYSYLPLAHVFERSCFSAVVRAGGRIGFSCGCLARIVEDLQLLRPTELTGVPRVFKRIYDKVTMTLAQSSPLKRWLFNYALSSKAAAERGSWSLIDWDKIVFSKMSAMLGGRMTFILNGAAPLKDDLHAWMQRVFRVSMCQCFGMTEVFGGVTCQAPPSNARFRESVGFVCDLGVVRLVDVPHLNYLTSDPRPAGEMWVKGESVTRGYFKDEEATKEAITEDGWLRTGDIGALNEDGSLSVIDRVKNMFKLSQGEYVPAEYLETLFSSSSLVTQAWVYGDSTESSVVCIVVPNMEGLCSALRDSKELGGLAARVAAEGPTGAAARELCDSRAVVDMVAADIESLSDEKDLASFMRVKALWLDVEQWTTENDLVTPTFKVKRAALTAKYADRIKALYDEVHSKQTAR